MMTSMVKPSARAISAQHSREKLMAAATTLFGQHSILNVSVQDICDAAGLTKGAFYHHFTSKDELFGQVYTPQLDLFLAVHYQVAADEAPEVRIHALAQCTLDFSHEIGRALTGESVAVMLSQASSSLYLHNRIHTRILHTALSEMADQNALGALTVDEAIMVYACFMVGVLVKWSSSDPARDPAVAWETVLREGIYRLFGRQG